MSHSPDYDVVVIGCGSIGSMALWQLTEMRPGARILGIERFDRVHTKGSYSGESRLFRVAVKEGGIYIPLVRQARQMWMEINKRSGRDIFLPIGAVSVGPADFPTMRRTMEVIEEYGLDHEVLDTEELARRYPVFAPSAESAPDIAIVDPAGGGIRPELAVAYAQQFALDAGAEIRSNTRVLDIDTQDPHCAVITTDQGIITAGKIIVTTGSWASDILPDLATHINVQTIPLTWYLPLDITGFRPENLPIFMRDTITASGEIWHCYGAPTLDGYSVKISHGDVIGQAATPEGLEALRTGILPEEVTKVFSERTQAFFAGVLDAPVRVTLHHDGFTTDHAPVLATVPGTAGMITVATGMSGNGMKFAPIYGRIAAELALHGSSPDLPDAFSYPINAREPSPTIIPATVH